MSQSRLVGNAIAIAQLSFGGDCTIFNTAGFQSAWRELTEQPLGDVAATGILCDHPRLERLKGGCHWRYLTEASKQRQSEGVVANV